MATRRASMRGRQIVSALACTLLLLLLLALGTASSAEANTAASQQQRRVPHLGRVLARGQRASTSVGAASPLVGAKDVTDGVGDEAHVLRSRRASNSGSMGDSAMQRIGALRLRARSLIEGQAQSALQAAAAATLEAVVHLPNKVNRRGAGGKAGRAGGKAGAAAGNAGQSGRKAGNAAGNAGQSGRKAGDAKGNAGQSGRKAGDAKGNGGQSGRKAGDASGDAGQSGRKAGDQPPVSPITGSPPPGASTVFPLTGINRKWPVNVYLRNQGDAATCWAHSALTLLELRSQMALVSNELKEWYSVDQVVKCVKNDGADGGSPLDALEFIINAELMTDAEVRAGKDIKCKKIDWDKRNSNQGRYSALLAWQPCINPGEDCSRMREYEWQMNFEFMLTPMLAYVDASQWHTYAPTFRPEHAELYARDKAVSYSAVAFPSAKCSSDPAKGDHLVILLGTVVCPKNGKKYWRVYNSWGKEWGINGYIYLEYEVNACGLANYPVGLSLMGGTDVLKRPILMLPSSMRQADALASPQMKQAGGVSGGKELHEYHLKTYGA